MKYYYGNNYKEAMSNNPVTIESTDLLAQYREVYSCAIPADDDLEDRLPTTVTVNINDLDYCPKDGDELSELLSDWLSDEYGFCHLGFDYDTDAISGDITIDNIIWDIDEEDY